MDFSHTSTYGLASLRSHFSAKNGKAAPGLVRQMQEKYQALKKETSEAQRATRDRDAAMEILYDWMSDFIAVVRIALKAEPEHLERLGIVDPS